MDAALWKTCLEKLEQALPPQQFNTWVRPLGAEVVGGTLRLIAPNRFVRDWVRSRLLDDIRLHLSPMLPGDLLFSIEASESGDVGSAPDGMAAASGPISLTSATPTLVTTASGRAGSADEPLNRDYTFESHVEGKTNQMARAAARMVGENPGRSYNPLFIYGPTALGKTHLMQAAGHLILRSGKNARVRYVTSESFVAEMVRALQNNAMAKFKQAYRNLDALLIDDIQFFVGKDRSQEEFFHTFNTLLDNKRQVIITADRFPKDLEGIEERLISRFASGLTVSIDPPELETRVAILMKKALSRGVRIDQDVAFFVARLAKSNVRELEGALSRLVASAAFLGRPIDMELARDCLNDLVRFQDRQVTLGNIQKTVAEHFNIRIADLNARSRARHVVRPRQVAMHLAKELTEHSLPEIGDAFGGRDHTTVIHACRLIKKLIDTDNKTKEDCENLLRKLCV